MAEIQAPIMDTPDTAVLEMASDLQTHALAGDWDGVEELAVRIRSAVMRVPERRRRDVILAARRSLEQVQSQAQTSRKEVADLLTAMRRGQHAKRAYAGMD